MAGTSKFAARKGAASEDGRTTEVSVVLPCLNEEETVAAVVREALSGLRAASISGEVIVVDNGSTDRSAELAAAAGAVVIAEPRRGYGSAYLAGLEHASGELIVLADADGTYPLHQLGALLAPFGEGADLVLGSRLNRSMEPGAMPFLNRWLGNPLLTGVLNLFFRAGVSDAHSGLRAIRRSALAELDLHTTGMEFASEMIVKATKRRLRIVEVPIEYRVRGGESKLSPYRDAWRHVRFMLTQSPTFLFLVPGGALFLGGLITMTALAPGPLDLFGRRWQIHSMIVAAIAAILGAQVVQLGVFARTYAVLFLGEHDRLYERVARHLTLERGLAAGAAILVSGVAIVGFIVLRWAQNGFGDLHEEHLSILGLALVGLGAQVIFSAFFLSILALPRRNGSER